MSPAATDSDRPTTKVGFAGLGRMGAPMAGQILSAGFDLTVFNRSAEKAKGLAERGATVADIPADLGGAADLVVTMLADGDAVEQVLFGVDGLLSEDRPGLIVIEMSTIGPGKAIELATRAQERGAVMLDSPVSGSVSHAEKAELTAMVGGPEQAFESARPVLAAMTRAQTRLGGTGSGAAMKLAVNLIIASTTHSVAEALVLAERSGVSRESAYEVICESAVASPFVKYKRDAYLDPYNTPTAFSIDLMRKDLSLALELGREQGIPMLAAAAAEEIMTTTSGMSGGDGDLVMVTEALAQVASGEAGQSNKEI